MKKQARIQAVMNGLVKENMNIKGNYSQMRRAVGRRIAVI